MGEVWRARDTRLDRSVAVKILPADFAADARLRIRFEREARTISQLDHPHICALFDVGENYLVMELLDGRTLAESIDNRGRLSLAEVTRYGAQIADALARAHRAGVVHRDVKPGNIMITKAGAKLLDFGLAKSFASDDDVEKTAPRTLTSKGTVLGTLQYMAPEQIAGSEADARTDIFALGAVLYEMVSGRVAFEGTTRTELIAAIVTGEPKPLSDVPAALQHAIARCLKKDRDDRWQSAQDVAEELRWIGSGAATMVAAPPVPGRRRWREAAAWLAAVLFAAIAVAAWLAFRPVEETAVIEATLSLEQNAPIDERSGTAVFSPDGKWLAYTARPVNGPTTIWIRSMESGVTRVVEGTENGKFPFWSPDSRFIGFAQRGGLVQKVPIAGGQPETIASGVNHGWTWSRGDVVLVVMGMGEAVHRVPASGGETKAVIDAKSLGAQVLWSPTFLADGNRFLFLAQGTALEQKQQNGIWMATLDGTMAPRFIVTSDTNAVMLDDGHLLYVRDGVLRARRFDLETLRAAGEPLTIAPVQTLFRYGLFSANNSGLLIWQPPGAAPRSELLLKNRKGERLAAFGGAGYYFGPRFSPDGRRIAVDRSDERASGDIWIFDRDRASRVSFDRHNETGAVWSPRGDEIAYVVEQVNLGGVVVRQRIGEPPEPVFEFDQEIVTPADWSPDGRYLAFDRTKTRGDAMVWSFAEKRRIPIAAAEEHREAAPVFSPDGKWIAYHSDESRRYEIYVQPFPPTGAKYQVSTDGGITPRWTRTGEIAWVDLGNRLCVAKVETTPSFRAAPAEVLFPIDQRDIFTPEFDAAADGNFLVNTPLPVPPPPMKLLVNWQRRFSK